jgi:hypothetical protein
LSKGAAIFAMLLFDATVDELNEDHAAIAAGLENGML